MRSAARKLAALVAGGAAIAALAFGLVAETAGADPGPNLTIGLVTCPLTDYNPTHFNLQIAETVTCTIDATGDLVGSPSSVTVVIRSTPLGNETVQGAVTGSTITFTYTGRPDGCETSNIAFFNKQGVNQGHQVDAHAGFAFVDSSDTALTCGGGGSNTAADLTVSKLATPQFTRTYKWGITKDVDQTKITDSSGSATFNYTVVVTPDAGTDSAWQVTGGIDVFNPNVGAITGVNVADTLPNGASCSVVDGTNQTIPGLSDVDFAYTCNYAATPSPLDSTNTATVTWAAGQGTPTTTATGTAPVDFSTSDPTTTVDDCVTVADPLVAGGTLGTACVADGAKTFNYAVTVTGTPGACVTTDNTATFTTNTSSATGSASKSVQLCTPVDLTVKKDATPSFKRTYNWTILKSVDKTLVKQVGGNATFNYTVKVDETGFTDSNWTLTGTITVTNPNDFEDIPLTGVTDAIDNGGSCSITSGSPTGTVAKSSSVTLGYTCTYAAAPSPASFTNTATATWDKTAASTPTGMASGTATGSFTTPTSTVNQTIHVTDPVGGGALGTATATDTTPFTSKSFTYSRTVPVPTSGCVSYPNTATITETGATSSKSVTVCGPLKTGALTIGYWQNKNGQGIITGQAKSGPCGSAAYLFGFAPFQGGSLTATSTCAQVATYVSGVIAAATCNGTCNAMLKAQMLATALNVYFSDPALGGNKIGAPAPIGGVNIDLTKICTNIPTCTTFEDDSSVFGSSSLTVSQILASVASHSNAGGTTWYANVKTTITQAKDVFDAINNQVVFGP